MPAVTWLPRTFRGRLWLIVGIACVIRVAFVWQVRDTLSEPWGYALAPGTDMPKYVRYARMVLQGDLLAEDVTISPLAPLVVLPVLLVLAGGNLVGAMMWQGVLGAAQVGLIGLIGRRYLSETGSLVAAGLAALYAPFIVHDAVPLTETTINVCFLLAWWSYLRVRETSTWGRAAGLGLSWGLAVAAKPTMAVLLPALVLGDAVERGWPSVWQLRGKLLVAVGVMGLAIAPFIWRAYRLSGEWLFVRAQTGYIVLQGNHPEANGMDRDVPREMRARFEEAVGGGPGYYRRRDALAVRWAVEYWRNEPRATLRLMARKIGLLLSGWEIPNNISQAYFNQRSFLKWPIFLGAGFLLPLAGLGLVVEWPRLRKWASVIAPVVMYAGLLVATFVTARLRLPLLPGAMLLATAGLVWLFHEGRRLDWLRMVATGAVALAMLALNQRAVARWVQPTIAATGQRERVAEGWAYRDGPWDTEAAYSAWIGTATGEIRKRLIVTGRDLAGIATVEVNVRCVVSGGGTILVKLNECEREMEFAADLRGQNLIATLPFPGHCVRIDNQIVLRVRPGTRLRVFLDDAWSYGRSTVHEAGEDFLHDTLGFRPPRPPHRIAGEFQVGLIVRD